MVTPTPRRSTRVRVSTVNPTSSRAASPPHTHPEDDGRLEGENRAAMWTEAVRGIQAVEGVASRAVGRGGEAVKGVFGGAEGRKEILHPQSKANWALEPALVRTQLGTCRRAKLGKNTKIAPLRRRTKAKERLTGSKVNGMQGVGGIRGKPKQGAFENQEKEIPPKGAANSTPVAKVYGVIFARLLSSPSGS
jgi:hypothetical protein